MFHVKHHNESEVNSMKTVTLNGEIFEVKDSRKHPLTVEHVNDYMERFVGKDLYTFYDRPSHIKQSIYDAWLTWCSTSGGQASHMQVSSANCQTFTIDAIWCDEKGYIKYFLHITKAHNYAYVVHID